MAVPLLLGAVAVGGQIMNGIGQMKSGNRAREAGEYNAAVAHRVADETLKVGAEEERRFRVMTKKMMGQGRAAIAASGIRYEGSALDVMQESAANAEMDALMIRYNSQQKAMAFRRDATMSRMAGQAAQTSARMGAVGSFMTGAADAYDRFGGSFGGISSLPVEGP